MTERVLGNDFWYKTLPVLSIGMIIWVVTTLLLGSYLSLGASGMSLVLMIASIIFYIIFWILAIVLALYKKNLFSMIFFFIASFFSGVISSTLIFIASSIFRFEVVLGIFLAAFLSGLGVTIGLLILGLLFRERITEKWLYPLILFGLLLIIIEGSLILIFGYNPYILITSIFVLIWLFGVILWDGSRLPNTIKEGYWMVAVVDIFLDMFNAIIRIFIILIETLSDFE